MKDFVILVDTNDREVGTAEKLEAHRLGLLHRAISVFVFNRKGELLLQRRQWDKYHSGGQWSNACCSHPRPGEESATAASRRLREEMGVACDLDYAFGFTYHVQLEPGLFEHEHDHVFIGRYDGPVNPDPEEVSATRWVSEADLRREIEADPERFTYWFRLIYDRVLQHASAA